MRWMRSPGRLFAWLGGVVMCAALASALSAGTASAAPLVPTSDPFYTYTGSLSDIAPGTVLRSRTTSFTEGSLTIPVITTQVLYRTTDELGAPSVTVATVIRPLGDVTKLVSYQMAYDGLASNCDPSYAIDGGTPTEATNNEEEQFLVPILLAGYGVVTADYEGENSDFAAGREEGMGTLDGIRAAENLLGLPASTQVAMMGYSGGAIATDWAAELASTYAPKLDIVGAAMGGIAVDLAHNLTYVNGSQEWSGAIPAALVGIARAFNINLSDYLSASGLAIAKTVGGTCLETDLGGYPGLTYQSLLKSPYTNIDQIEPFVTALNTLTMGTGGVPREPLYMGVGDADGTGDDVMVDKDDEALAHTYCGDGLAVQFMEYNGANHGTAAVEFLPGALAFVLDRLGGLAATNGCASIGTGNSLAPLKYTPLAKTSTTSTTIYHLHMQITSASGSRVHLRLRAFRSAIRGVRVQLIDAARKLLATATFNAARDHLVSLTLTARRTLAAGTYTVVVTVPGQTLATKRFTVRSRK